MEDVFTRFVEEKLDATRTRRRWWIAGACTSLAFLLLMSNMGYTWVQMLLPTLALTFFVTAAYVATQNISMLSRSLNTIRSGHDGQSGGPS